MKRKPHAIHLYLWFFISFSAVSAGFLPLENWGLRDIIWSVVFYAVSWFAAKELKDY